MLHVVQGLQKTSCLCIAVMAAGFRNCAVCDGFKQQRGHTQPKTAADLSEKRSLLGRSQSSQLLLLLLLQELCSLRWVLGVCTALKVLQPKGGKS